MISPGLLSAIRCPDCGGSLHRDQDVVRCERCARAFLAREGFLDLRPAAAFAEQTKYLDEALHTDARHEAIAPPLLGSKIRHDVLRRFLAPRAGDRVIDLGCGNGRAMCWHADTGASLMGVDISPFFAPEAIQRCDLILGDLRRLPLRDGAFNKAWSLDVLEHVSQPAFRDVLREAHRVLDDDGRLFVYTHVRTNGWPAAGVRAVNRLAAWCERRGWLDLRQERLRKSDHVNPIRDHEELKRVVGDCGFEIERILYYTPIIGAFLENVAARVVEQALARRRQRRDGPAAATPAAATRAARAAAQASVRRGGLTYRVVMLASMLMKIDLLLFGRVRSGPYFALLRKLPASRMAR
jgi:SAM-dependent methyltransferase